jgi:TRAP-type mannitol/chloroaromatic compound transport system substrate-binding protein
MVRFGWLLGLVGALALGLYIGATYFTEVLPPPRAAATAETDAEAAPAQVKWKLASTFFSQWPIHGDLGLLLVENVRIATGGTVELKFFEPGALVPTLEVFDAVSTGAVDAAWSSPGYWAGKEPAMPIFTTVPFGPNASEYLAWLYEGGGEELFREVYAKHNIHPLHCGLHSPEGSGWFREPIESPEDLRGLKMRFFGLGARVMEKLGVSTQLIAGGDVYPALELGTIDALEFSMPVSDLNQGFWQVAKHYYLPGWHQQTSLFELIVNLDRWNELSVIQHEQIALACSDLFRAGAAMSESMQVGAIKELKAKGVTLHEWPPEMIELFRQATAEVMAEEAAKDETFAKVKDETFAKVWESLSGFRAEYREWRELGYLD